MASYYVILISNSVNTMAKSVVESFMPPEKAELTKPKEIKKWTDD